VRRSDSHLTARGTAVLVALVIGAWAMPACSKDEPPAPKPVAKPEAKKPERYVLKRAPKVELTPAEEEIVAALAAFYRTANRALTAPGARNLPPEVIAKGLKAFSDPLLERFGAIADDYHALDEDRQRVVIRQFALRHTVLVREFAEAMSTWTEQFEPLEKTEEFRQVARSVLREWHDARSMWVFNVWSEDATREARVYAVPRPELIEWQRAQLRAGREHDVIVLPGGELREITLESNCLECHGTDARERAIALLQPELRDKYGVTDEDDDD